MPGGVTPPRTLARGQALLLLAVLVLLWGCNWPLMKIVLNYAPPLWFAALRMAMGAVTLLLALALMGRLRLPPRGDLPLVFTIGLLQMAAYMALVNLALMSVPAGRSAVLAYTVPLWVAPGAVLLLGERLSRGRLLGLLLGVTGLVVLFNPLAFPWHDSAALAGNALLLVAALAWAAAILFTRRRRWRSSALALAPWQLLVATPPLLLLALLFEGVPAIEWSQELIWLMLYNGPLATGFCYLLIMTLTMALPAVTLSLGLLAIPACGVLASTLALGEALPPSLLAGMILILGGLVAVNLPSASPSAAGGSRA